MDVDELEQEYMRGYDDALQTAIDLLEGLSKSEALSAFREALDTGEDDY